MVLPLLTICEKDIGVLTVNNKCSNPSLQCESAVQKATQLQGRMSTVQVLLQGQVSLDHDLFWSTVSRLGHLGLNQILNCLRVFNPP